LWRARTSIEGPTDAYLAWFGRPITYDYLRGRFPLSAYQTVFARDPGSAEMPSAARPFTDHLVTDLAIRGVTIAPITLHAGVSSLEAGEQPLPERFRVPAATARLVEHTKRDGGRVIAVGTTVTRALETVAREDGSVAPDEGWTDLMLSPERPARVVDGLITGWHTPESSHLLLLEAVVGEDLVNAAYAAALEEKYLWHEFGDSSLFLPARSRRC
jgi:S-adenosylmethionine:tRNA ribosyltransferase-isomerase